MRGIAADCDGVVVCGCDPHLSPAMVDQGLHRWRAQRLTGQADCQAHAWRCPAPSPHRLRNGSRRSPCEESGLDRQAISIIRPNGCCQIGPSMGRRNRRAVLPRVGLCHGLSVAERHGQRVEAEEQHGQREEQRQCRHLQRPRCRILLARDGIAHHLTTGGCCRRCGSRLRSQPEGHRSDLGSWRLRASAARSSRCRAQCHRPLAAVRERAPARP